MKTENIQSNTAPKMVSNVSVLIVGAGPTGLTVAMELSRMGIPIMIIDKLAGPSETSRALAVQSRTIELLSQRGLSEEMIKKGNPASATTIYNEKKRLGKVNLRLIDSRYNFCLLIPQSETEDIMRSQLGRQGVQIRWGVEMTGFIQQNDSTITAVITNADGSCEEVHATYLISAEGAHSVSRKLLGLSFDGKTMGQNYALADLHIDGSLPENELSVFIGKRGFVAAFPMGDKRFRLMVTDPDNHTKNDVPPTLPELQKLYDNVVHLPGRLYEINWASRYGINSRMMHTLRSGNIFFGGDSAHIHSPAGGQGMNTGIQDMINLAWKLSLVIKGYAKPDLLDTYEEERIPVIEGLLNTTERATDLFNSLNPLVYSMMSLFISPLLSLKFIQKRGTSVIGEVAHDYKRSSLSQTMGQLGEVSGGMRLPDTGLNIHATDLLPANACFEGDLYLLLDPSLFTLLVVNADEAFTEEISIPATIVNVYKIKPLGDESRKEFTIFFGTEPGFLLVRPDSYVALSGSIARINEISDWFKHRING